MRANAWKILIGLTLALSLGLSTFSLIHSFSQPPQPQTLSAPVPIGGAKPYIDVTLPPYLADNTGTNDAATPINNALAAAGSNYNIYLPAGTYNVGTGVVGGNGLINLTNNGTVIFGDGVGKTTVQWNNATVTGANATVFWMKGNNQWIHDLTIANTAGQSGGGAWYAITTDGTGLCYRPRVSNVEIINAYGGTSAGGGGINLGSAYNNFLFTTTTTTSITANTSTVITPVSMNGIYTGAWLQLVNGGTNEYLTVSAVTATTFTATPTNTYSGTTTVNVPSMGAQWGYYENISIHDCPAACGIVGTSLDNTFVNVRVHTIGTLNTQHGWYIQGGRNTLMGCKVEGAFGASYQFQCPNGVQDTSGNRMIGCLSLNPKTYHVIYNQQSIFGVTNPDSNPAELIGRNLMIDSCEFKNTKGNPTASTPFLIEGPGVLINNCFLEDCTNAGVWWVNFNPNANAYVSNCALTNCLFQINNPIPNSPIGFVNMSCTDSLVASNRMYMVGMNATCIKVDGPHNTVKDNYIYLTGTANGISTTNLANNCTIARNRFRVLGGNSCAGIRQGTAPQAQNVLYDGNTFTGTPTGTNYAFRFDAAGPSVPTGIMTNNTWDTNLTTYFRTAPQDVVYRNNAGQWAFQGNATASQLDQACGTLTPYPMGANTVTAKLAMTLDANQNVAATATNQTVWQGIAVSSGGVGGVGQVKITAAGTGFTSAPTVAFGAGSAAATADLSVISTTVTAAGSGYTKAPRVVFTTNGASSAAQGFATLKQVGTPTVVSGGTGYTNNDVLSITGGSSGTLGTLTATVSGGVVTSAAINAAGSYSVPPQGVVSVTGGTGSGATFTLSWGVNTIPVTYGGAGYTAVPTISILGDGSSATATATCGVGTIKVTTESTGYTTPPSVTISSGGGSGATAVAFLEQTLIAGVGCIVPVTTDGTWTAGHYGIASTTTAGQIHDNSTTQPTAPASYGTFLDSGTGSGTARFLVLRCNGVCDWWVALPFVLFFRRPSRRRDTEAFYQMAA